MVQHGATWCNLVQDGARWCKMVQNGARWRKMAQDGPRWRKMAQDGARWRKMGQDGAIPCNSMQYLAIQFNTLQCHAIPCIINNCWRSLPLPCRHYKAIFYFYSHAFTFDLSLSTKEDFNTCYFLFPTSISTTSTSTSMSSCWRRQRSWSWTLRLAVSSKVFRVFTFYFLRLLKGFQSFYILLFAWCLILTPPQSGGPLCKRWVQSDWQGSSGENSGWILPPTLQVFPFQIFYLLCFSPQEPIMQTYFKFSGSWWIAMVKSKLLGGKTISTLQRYLHASKTDELFFLVRECPGQWVHTYDYFGPSP